MKSLCEHPHYEVQESSVALSQHALRVNYETMVSIPGHNTM